MVGYSLEKTLSGPDFGECSASKISSSTPTSRLSMDMLAPMVLRIPRACLSSRISNSETLLQNLGNKLSEEQQAYCAPVQGKETKASGFCLILDGLAKEARRRNPARFAHKAKEVYFARPVPDAQAWKHIMDELEAWFANTRKKPFVLSKDDPLHKAVEQLIPWKITRLQATWTPQARRFLNDIPFTHRGAVLRRADDEFVLEAEDLSSVQCPKQRCTSPIQVGLFFFGYPNQQPQEEQGPEIHGGDPPEQPAPNLGDLLYYQAAIVNWCPASRPRSGLKAAAPSIESYRTRWPVFV